MVTRLEGDLQDGSKCLKCIEQRVLGLNENYKTGDRCSEFKTFCVDTRIFALGKK